MILTLKKELVIVKITALYILKPQFENSIMYIKLPAV